MDTKMIVASVLLKYDITPVEVKEETINVDNIQSRYEVHVKVDNPGNLSDITTTYKVINEIEDKLWDAGHDYPEVSLTNVEY